MPASALRSPEVGPRRSLARVAAAGISLGLVLAGWLPGLVQGDNATWLVTADRSSVSRGVRTTVTLTVPGPPPDQSGKPIGCVGVYLPGAYAVNGTSYTDSRRHAWHLSDANGVVWATIVSNSQGLNDASNWLRLRITVTGTVWGRADWYAAASDQNDCGDLSLVSPAIPMSVVGAGPKPTPRPIPKPAPKPTPTPAQPSPSPSPIPSASPAPSGLPGTGPGAGGISGSGPFSGAAGSQPLGKPELTVADVHGGPGLTFGNTGFGSGVGSFTWVVPGVLLGLPGLLVFLVLGLQALGVAAFLPIVRRVLRPSPDAGKTG